MMQKLGKSGAMNINMSTDSSVIVKHAKDLAVGLN